MNQKNIYVVLGMARTGTSVISSGLNTLGIDFGNHLAPGRKIWNPKGFWEDQDIVYKVNRKVLLALNYEWMSSNLTSYLADEHSSVCHLKNFAIDILKQRMQNTNCWGFKDPRTTHILPFWQAIFKELNYQDRYIIALRNPLSAAYSFQRVSGGTDIEVGLLLWIIHLIPAIEGTIGKNRIIVDYEQMMKDPHVQLNRMKDMLQIPLFANAKSIELYTQEFLDKSLQHYEYNIQDLKTHPATIAFPICIRMYELFLKLAKDEMSFTSKEFSLAWENIKSEFALISPTYQYLDTLLKRNKNLERQIRTIRKSLPWKLIYPLRFIDDALRKRRRRKKSLLMA